MSNLIKLIKKNYQQIVDEEDKPEDELYMACCVEKIDVSAQGMDVQYL